MPTEPGDGRTSPFGDGAGKTQGGNVPGNNFLTNPGGSRSGGGGTNFLTSPGGRSQGANPVAGSREAVADRSTDDAAPGGLIPKIQASPGVGVGVGSIGNSQKSHRLGGGGE